jgi:hypothetical protein
MEQRKKTRGETVLPWLNLGVAVAAVFIAGGVAVYTHWQTDAANQSAKAAKTQADAALEANARAGGRLQANLVLLDSIPNSETLPQELRKKIAGTDFTTAYLPDVDRLIKLNPRIVLRNAGDEPVETIRITVAYEGWSINERNFFAFRLRDGEGPIIAEQVHKDDHVLDQKLQKNEVVTIPLTKGLLHQMLQGQQGEPATSDCFGEFRVRASGKVAGGVGLDGLRDDMLLRLRLLWTPAGFKEEKCRPILDRFQPDVQIMKDGRR